MEDGELLDRLEDRAAGLVDEDPLGDDRGDCPGIEQVSHKLPRRFILQICGRGGSGVPILREECSFELFVLGCRSVVAI